MADSIATIRAAYEANPDYAVLTRTENGVVVTLTADERDAELDDWAANEHQRQLDADAEAAEAEERRLLRLAAEALQSDIAALEGSGSLTARQQRDMLARTDRILLRLGRVLVQKGVL